MTQWGVRGSFRRILESGCDAVECEKFWGADVTQWGVRGSFSRILGSGCNAVLCERQFCFYECLATDMITRMLHLCVFEAI